MQRRNEMDFGARALPLPLAIGFDGNGIGIKWGDDARSYFEDERVEYLTEDDEMATAPYQASEWYDEATMHFAAEVR